MLLSSNANVRGGEPDYGTYFMYYFGGSLEAEPLAEVVPCVGGELAEGVPERIVRHRLHVQQLGGAAAHVCGRDGELNPIQFI